MNLFGKAKKKPLQLEIPIKGEIIDITQVPDEVFANKYVGDGVAVYPAEGKVYSPVDGTILLMTETGHAVGIRTKEGFEILIHIGLDTVNMKGEGFENLVSEGERVKAGQLLVKFDLELVKQRAKSTVSPVVVSNMEVVEEIVKNVLTEKGHILMTIFGKTQK